MAIYARQSTHARDGVRSRTQCSNSATTPLRGCRGRRSVVAASATTPLKRCRGRRSAFVTFVCCSDRLCHRAKRVVMVQHTRSAYGDGVRVRTSTSASVTTPLTRCRGRLSVLVASAMTLLTACRGWRSVVVTVVCADNCRSVPLCHRAKRGMAMQGTAHTLETAYGHAPNVVTPSSLRPP
jgi:hypothetical protein